VIGGIPVGQRVGSAPVTWQRVGFACPQYGFDYAPNWVGVCKCGSANSQQGWITQVCAVELLATSSPTMAGRPLHSRR
jgi:hypothetical protein